MMDEPTSALSGVEIPVLFRSIRELAAHGVGIVYISHRLEELLDVADDVTVLRDGAVVGADATADESVVAWIVQRMTGETLRSRVRPEPAGRVGEPILAVNDLGCLRDRRRTVSLHGIASRSAPGRFSASTA